MPAPLAPWLGALLGLFLAWSDRTELERNGGRAWSTRSAAVAWTFGVALLGPCTGWFLCIAPDWSLAYVVDGAQLHPFVASALALVAAGSVPLGHAVGAPLVGQRLGGSLAFAAAAFGLPALAFGLLAARRLGVAASYAQYHGDWAVRPLSSTALGLAVALALLTLLVAVGLAYRGLTQSRLAPQDPRAR